MNISNAPTIVTSVTSKGQVTIPAEIRQYLGIKPKDKVRFEVEDNGSVRVVPASSRLAALFASVGATTVHKDDQSLRREFAEGVAEATLRKGKNK